MNEREKILESIKKGILSPEEGLDLLESLGLSEADKGAEETSEAETDCATEEVSEAEKVSEIEADASEDLEQTDTVKAEEAIKQELDLDQITEQETEQEKNESDQSSEQGEEPSPNHPRYTDSVSSMIDEWENSSESVQEEADPVRSKIDEFDHALQTKKETLREKKDVFRELNLEAELGILSAENQPIYDQMKSELADLEEEIDLLTRERSAVDEDLFVTLESPHVSDRFFDVPEDFEEQRYQPFDRPKVQPKDFSSRLGQMVNRAARTVSDTVANEFDWKTGKQNYYGTTRTHFNHPFTFEEIDAHSLDIKLAKGKVILKMWEDEEIKDVKVDASVDLIGQMDEVDPIDAFLERSQIEANDYRFLFHVPNKRVHATLTFYLPKCAYNDLRVQLLTGDLMIEDLAAKNVSIKAVDGTVLIKDIDASTLEIEGTTNEIEIRDGRLLDTVVETVTGTIISKADASKAEYSLINGDIKLTMGNDALKKINAHTINGNVKVSLPKTIGLNGVAKTGTGTINYRFSNCETLQERNGHSHKVLRFQRLGDEPAQINVSSKAGNIFLKDYDN